MRAAAADLWIHESGLQSLRGASQSLITDLLNNFAWILNLNFITLFSLPCHLRFFLNLRLLF